GLLPGRNLPRVPGQGARLSAHPIRSVGQSRARFTPGKDSCRRIPWGAGSVLFRRLGTAAGDTACMRCASPPHFSAEIHFRAALVVGLAVLAAQGCLAFPEPPTLRVDTDVTGRIAPTEPQQPVTPSLLPNHQSNPKECLVAVIDVDGLFLDADSTGLGSLGENTVSLFRERLDAIAGN